MHQHVEAAPETAFADLIGGSPEMLAALGSFAA